MFWHHDWYPVFLPLDEYVGRVEAAQVQHLMDGNLQHREHILIAVKRIRIRMFLGLLDPQGPDPNPDPLVRSMDPRIRIRIHTKMSWIRNTDWYRWNRASVSAYSTGAYTATLYVMVTTVKEGGRAPPTSPAWANFSIVMESKNPDYLALSREHLC